MVQGCVRAHVATEFFREGVSGWEVHFLLLFLQMCGQYSLLFSGAMLKLFKTKSIDVSLERNYPKGSSLALSIDVCFYQQLPQAEEMERLHNSVTDELTVFLVPNLE